MRVRPRPDQHPTPERAASAALHAAAATAAYALLHTALASHTAKRLAARLAGERRARGWYRVGYNAHAVVGLGALAAYVWRHRGPFVWRTGGAARLALRAGQVLSVGGFGKALWDAGLGDLSGWRPARGYLLGRPLRPVPDGQGPFEDDAGRPAPRGLSLRTRQPANVAIVPVLWVVPSARAGWVGMSLAFTAYAVAGSWSSERRLRARWGAPYERYRARVPFLVPRLRPAGDARTLTGDPRADETAPEWAA